MVKCRVISKHFKITSIEGTPHGSHQNNYSVSWQNDSKQKQGSQKYKHFLTDMLRPKYFIIRPA